MTSGDAEYPPQGFTDYFDLACADGHHIKENAFVFTDAGLRCTHRDPAPKGRGYGPECGNLIYVLAAISIDAKLFTLADLAIEVARAEAEKRPLWVYAVAVEAADLRRWQVERWSFQQILRELGALFPRRRRREWRDQSVRRA